MEYEAYEPDPNDEYYDQMCSVMYAKLWNERSDLNGQQSCDTDDPKPVLYALAG